MTCDDHHQREHAHWWQVAGCPRSVAWTPLAAHGSAAARGPALARPLPESPVRSVQLFSVTSGPRPGLTLWESGLRRLEAKTMMARVTHLRRRLPIPFLGQGISRRVLAPKLRFAPVD